MAESLKIAFEGTVSSGKTTLFNSCRDRYKDNFSFNFVPEVAENFFATHSDIEPAKRGTLEIQEQLVDEIMRQENKAHGEVVVCDRTVLSGPVFCYAAGNQEDGDILDAKIDSWIPSYGIIFLCDPSGIPLENTNIRKEDEEKRKMIHEHFLSYLNRKKVVYTLLTGSAEDRMKQVNGTIQNALQQV